MTELFKRFGLEHAFPKLNSPVVLLGMTAIWVALLICVIASIRSQSFPPRQRTFWICLVVGFPILGILAYLPFSIRREDLPQIFLLKSRDRDRSRSRNPRAPQLEVSATKEIPKS